MVNGRKEVATSMMVRQVLAREGARVSVALTAKKERSVEAADGVERCLVLNFTVYAMTSSKLGSKRSRVQWPLMADFRGN